MIKEKFYALLTACGFKSLREFARTTGIGVGNIHSNLTGRYKLSIERAFVFAETLNVSIDDILCIFYPDEMSRLQQEVVV